MACQAHPGALTMNRTTSLTQADKIALYARNRAADHKRCADLRHAATLLRAQELLEHNVRAKGKSYPRSLRQALREGIKKGLQLV